MTRRRPSGPLVAGFALIAALALGACSLLGGSGSGSPGASPQPSPTPGPIRTIPELKLAIIDRFGPLWYCDPDFYPVAHEDEAALALQRFPEVQADAEAFAAIEKHLDLAGRALTNAQKLAIYREWKVLNAIALAPIGNDAYRFDYLAQPPSGAAEGTRSGGTIDARGTITIEQQAPAGEPICPICLARGTHIATPGGGVAVERLVIGDAVWTLDAAGSLIAGRVIAIGSIAAPAGHEVVDLVLLDGRSVTASPRHQLADGRRIGDLRPGDPVGGSVVRSVQRVPYTGGRTFDIAVSGPTGLYLVDGVALRSTLVPGS